jgi:hypothetical protein
MEERDGIKEKGVWRVQSTPSFQSDNVWEWGGAQFKTDQDTQNSSFLEECFENVKGRGGSEYLRRSAAKTWKAIFANGNGISLEIKFP